MSYNELIQLYFERSNALQWYWTLYVVIIGGLLAFSSLRLRKDVLSTALVCVLYCFFAYKNMGAIGDVTEQRLAIHASLKAAPTETAAAAQLRAKLEPTLDPPTLESVRNFHILSDVITVAALWAMELRRRAVYAESKANG